MTRGSSRNAQKKEQEKENAKRKMEKEEGEEEDEERSGRCHSAAHKLYEILIMAPLVGHELRRTLGRR